MPIGFVPMASSGEKPGVAAFVRVLYDLGGFDSWGEYARDVGVLASTMSDWQLGKNSPSGPNLLRLIHAATDRAPLAMREAAEQTSPLARVLERLESLGGAAERERAALEESLVSIDVRLSKIEGRLDAQAERGSEGQPA